MLFHSNISFQVIRGCRFWTYDRFARQCYLKHGRGQVVKGSKVFVSGSAECRGEYNIEEEIQEEEEEKPTAGMEWNTECLTVVSRSP